MSTPLSGAVVHVVVAGEVGGAERMLVDLAGRTHAGDFRRHSVALLTPSARLRALFHGAGLDVDDRGSVREGPLAYLARSFGPRDAAWIAGILAKRRASIVHLHTFASQVVGTRAALRTGAYIVRTEHSTRVYDDPSCWPFSRWSLRRAHAVVGVSEHVARVARDKAPWVSTKLRVIANGVDVAHFAPAPPASALRSSPTARSTSSDAAPVRFVALGRLDPRKGLDTAIEALARVPNATLDIVGEGCEKAALTALASRLGVSDRVRFVGFVDDVRGAIANADLVLSSARSEGLGIALLEAMAMARAVVALPTGGVPEIVRDGETGWLAAGHDARALACVMQDAADRPDEVRLRAARARADVEGRFSVHAMRQRYEAVYSSLVATHEASSP